MRLLGIPRYAAQLFYGAVLKIGAGKCGGFPMARTPLEWYGLKRMSFGSRLQIGAGSWLAVLDPTEECRDPGLDVGSGTVLGNYNHIIAAGRVIIGENVLTADHVYISDNTHEYRDVDVPVMHQKVRFLRETAIGDGSWIGENVCIFGAKVGRHCVIGANSVVNRDIPDFSVAAGAPARVIRRYDPEKDCWVRTGGEES